MLTSFLGGKQLLQVLDMLACMPVALLSLMLSHCGYQAIVVMDSLTKQGLAVIHSIGTHGCTVDSSAIAHT